MQTNISKSQSQPFSLTLQQSKPIRSLIFIRQNTLICLMSLLEIFIIQPTTCSIIKTIKRMATPKYLFTVGNYYLLVHFNDNYCILYDTVLFQEFYVMIGVPNDHKGIKVSEDGFHLVYGNDTAMQMWNIPRCQIQMISHKLKYISCYNISYNGSSIYLGNYNGQIQLVQMITIKHLRNDKVPYPQLIKPHTKVILAIQIIQNNNMIASIDYNLQCALIKLSPVKFQIFCKIGSSVNINRPICLMYGLQNDYLYFCINQVVYRVEKQSKILGSQGNVMLVRFGNRVKIGKLEGDNKNKITLYDDQY